MDIEILEEEPNSLLHRTDVRFRVSHDDATPDRLQIRDSLAAQLDRDSDEVVVRELETKFGMRKTVGHAKVYDTPADAAEIEQEYMLNRNKIAAEDEAAEAE
ncbi:MAG: 30S ribosomal protein S24e [Halobacteriaceae archaeon]